jgi:hypothetical protein
MHAAVLFLLAAGVLPACGLRGPRPLPPAEAAATLLERLASRRAAVTALRARARLRAGLQGMWTRQALVVHRPDRIRVDVLTPMGLALALGTTDALLWAYEPAERVRYEGSATPANLVRVLGAPLALADVVDILLGLPPARAAVGPPVVAPTAEGHRLTLPLRDGEQRVWFAPGTLDVVRAEEARRDGVVMRVAFGGHEDGFPRVVDVESPRSGGSVRLHYEAVELNPDVAAALFAPPPAERVLPLEAIGRPGTG